MSDFVTLQAQHRGQRFRCVAIVVDHEDAARRCDCAGSEVRAGNARVPAALSKESAAARRIRFPCRGRRLRLARCLRATARACRTSARPRPRPPCASSSRRLALIEHVENARARSGSRMPTPSSRTSTHDTPSSLHSTATTMCPPGGVYFTALLSRLRNTCVNRTASPSKRTGSDGKLHLDVMALAFGERSHRFHGAGDDRQHVDGVLAQLELSAADPAGIQQVVDEPTSWLTCRSMTSRPHCSCSSVALACRIRSTAERIGCSGLRSSWASIARNSSLRRSASASASPASAVGSRFSRSCTIVASSSAGPRRDALLEVRFILSSSARLPIEIEEDADFRAQDLRHDGDRHVVDRAGGVALTRSRSVSERRRRR